MTGAAAGTTGKTHGQMEAEHAEWRDQQQTSTSCSFCPWEFTGTVAEARERAAEHRQVEHPEAKPTRGRRKKPASAPMPMAPSSQQLVARDAARRANEPGSRARWTRERAIAAVLTEAERLGHPPSITDVRASEGRLPSPPTAKKLFGSHADMIAASGFERPTPKTSYGAGAARRPPERVAARLGASSGSSEHSQREVLARAAAAYSELGSALAALADTFPAGGLT